MSSVKPPISHFFRRREIMLAAAILLLAGFLRFWQITRIPPGLYPDEAVNGNNALEALENGKFRVFYPDNNGREGLFVNLEVVSLKIFGPEIWALRIISATFGTFTILGLYLLTKELFGRKPAYFAAFFTAVSFWHINFSRIGFRAIMVPFFTVFSFYFLFRAFKNQKIIDYVLAGICLGSGLYTYPAFRFIPILALIVSGIYWQGWWRGNTPRKLDIRWFRRGLVLKTDFWKWCIFIAVAFAVALPLGFYFLGHPQDFFGRAAQVSIFNSPKFWPDLGLGIVKAFRKFFWEGDFNWRHNMAGAPQLLWPVGFLSIIGFVVSVKEIVRRKFAAVGSWFLATGFFLMELPEIMTNEGLPHSLRSIGTIPFVFIFSGLGARFILSEIRYKSSGHKFAVNAVIALILAGVGILGIFQYFYLFDNRPEVKTAFSQELVDIGDYLNALPGDVKKTVIVNWGGLLVDGIPMPAQTIKFMTYRKSQVAYLTEEMIDSAAIKASCRGGGIIIPMAYDPELWDRLELLLPAGTKINAIDGFWEFRCEQ